MHQNWFTEINIFLGEHTPSLPRSRWLGQPHYQPPLLQVIFLRHCIVLIIYVIVKLKYDTRSEHNFVFQYMTSSKDLTYHDKTTLYRAECKDRGAWGRGYQFTVMHGVVWPIGFVLTYAWIIGDIQCVVQTASPKFWSQSQSSFGIWLHSAHACDAAWVVMYKTQ